MCRATGCASVPACARCCTAAHPGPGTPATCSFVPAVLFCFALLCCSIEIRAGSQLYLKLQTSTLAAQDTPSGPPQHARRTCGRKRCYALYTQAAHLQPARASCKREDGHGTLSRGGCEVQRSSDHVVCLAMMPGLLAAAAAALGAAARARLSPTLDVTRVGCELQRPCMCPSASPVGRQLLIPSRDSAQLPSELLAHQMPLHSRTSTLTAHWSANGPVLRDRATWRATGSIMWHTARLRSGTLTPGEPALTFESPTAIFSRSHDASHHSRKPRHHPKLRIVPLSLLTPAAGAYMLCVQRAANIGATLETLSFIPAKEFEISRAYDVSLEGT